MSLSFKTTPFNSIIPALIFSNPAKHLRNVVFPDPLSPIKETISPFSTEKLRFLIN